MIRRAVEKDLDAVNKMLLQVLKVHSDIRPDIFISKTKKYSDSELLEIFKNNDTPVFVWTDESDVACGYVFCCFEKTEGKNNMYDRKALYIDDLCVDENFRRKNIAAQLFEFTKQFAVEEGCDCITLNVWEHNDSARAFYDAMGMKPLKTMMELSL